MAVTSQLISILSIANTAAMWQMNETDRLIWIAHLLIILSNQTVIGKWSTNLILVSINTPLWNYRYVTLRNKSLFTAIVWGKKNSEWRIWVNRQALTNLELPYLTIRKELVKKTISIVTIKKSFQKLSWNVKRKISYISNCTKV